jgi:hypothetical protein
LFQGQVGTLPSSKYHRRLAGVIPLADVNRFVEPRYRVNVRRSPNWDALTALIFFGGTVPTQAVGLGYLESPLRG